MPADDPAIAQEPIIPVDNVGTLLANALQDAGIVGIDESIEPAILNRAFRQLNWLLAEWARKRNLSFRIEDYAFTSTGANTYLVGNNQTVNINPRPDRLEYAFVRFINAPGPPQFPVDIPLDIIQSHEDYSRITVKSIGTLPWRIFYDPAWPNGILFPWPIPQPTIYEIHVGFKCIPNRFSSTSQLINLPPEYLSAMNWCLVRRLRESYQMPPSPTVDSLARNALNAIRLANTAVPTLVTPPALRNRNRSYDYRSDDADGY